MRVVIALKLPAQAQAGIDRKCIDATLGSRSNSSCEQISTILEEEGEEDSVFVVDWTLQCGGITECIINR